MQYEMIGKKRYQRRDYMNNLACYGSYDALSSQCQNCNDNDCKKIEELKMKCDERCRKDVTSCNLWDTEHCLLRRRSASRFN